MDQQIDTRVKSSNVLWPHDNSLQTMLSHANHNPESVQLLSQWRTHAGFPVNELPRVGTQESSSQKKQPPKMYTCMNARYFSVTTNQYSKQASAVGLVAH